MTCNDQGSRSGGGAMFVFESHLTLERSTFSGCLATTAHNRHCSHLLTTATLLLLQSPPLAYLPTSLPILASRQLGLRRGHAARLERFDHPCLRDLPLPRHRRDVKALGLDPGTSGLYSASSHATSAVVHITQRSLHRHVVRRASTSGGGICVQRPRAALVDHVVVTNCTAQTSRGSSSPLIAAGYASGGGLAFFHTSAAVDAVVVRQVTIRGCLASTIACADYDRSPTTSTSAGASGGGMSLVANSSGVLVE